MRIPVTGRDALAMLNGFLCVYKPKDLPIAMLKKRLVTALCSEANEQFGDWHVPTIDVPIVKPHPASEALVIVGTRKQLDYSSHPMMVGEMFRPEDFELEELAEMESSSSGVCCMLPSRDNSLIQGSSRLLRKNWEVEISSPTLVLGINDGCDELDELRDRGWLSEYYIEGQLGEENYKHEIRGKITRKAEYGHVNRHQVAKLLSKIRSNFKRYSFDLANVDLQSQEAFELARKGTPRQRIMGRPIVYSAELTNFRTPRFSLRIQASGESDAFMRLFTSKMGEDLATLACVRRLRRVRQGPFTLEHALLDKYFHLDTLLRNILMSNAIVKTALSAEDPDVIQVRTGSELEETTTILKKFHLGKELEERASEPEDCLYLTWGRYYEQ